MCKDTVVKDINLKYDTSIIIWIRFLLIFMDKESTLKDINLYCHSLQLLTSRAIETNPIPQTSTLCNS